ncbi:MAG TPA: NADPH:quinone oxidoreductase family protein, partial [Rhodospirillales bacterium]|nr:NADPH:quinone oxidoreductase family protein [Rhodospirillales bacterium]
IIAGRYQIKPPLPFSPGFEVAGEVLECAPGVTRCKPGDRVMAVLDYGGFAEEVVANQESVFVLSDSVSDEVAAAFPVAYGTSHLGLKYKCALEAGESVLVHGAAGGVGLTAVEIAKRIGATVIATASGAEKLSVAAAAGADHTIDSRAEDLRDQVKALTGGRGVDVVYDPVGGKLFEESLRCTANGGRILIVGFASGDVPQIPANILLVKNIAAIGYYWGAHKTVKPAWMRASFEELLSWLAAGRLNPLVSQTFSLDEAPEAMQALKARRTTGKVVLRIGS